MYLFEQRINRGNLSVENLVFQSRVAMDAAHVFPKVFVILWSYVYESNFDALPELFAICSID